MQTVTHVVTKPFVAPARGRYTRTTAAAVIAVAIATAMQSAPAESRGRDSLLSLPAASEAAAPAAAVVSEVPFQRYVRLPCSDTPSQCTNRLPAVLAKERLVIQFVSCHAVTPPGGLPLANFVMVVTDAQATKLFAAHFVAPTYANGQYFIAAQPTLLTVDANRVLRLAANAPSLSFAECGISGVKQKLG